MSLIAILGTLLGVSLPIVAWGYVFSYFGGLQFGGRKFFLGIIAGSLAVLPILYAPDLFSELQIPHFISLLSQDTYTVFGFLESFALSILLPIVLFMCAISGICFLNIRVFFKRIGMITILAITILALLAGIMITCFSGDSGELAIKGALLHGFPVIAAFYIFVAGLEEMLKHLGIYSHKSLITDSRTEILLVSVYIALGFVFLENMLYLSGVYEKNGFGSSFFGLLFSRSLVSLLLHVFATLLLTVGFYAWLQNTNKGTMLIYVKYFLFALLAHAAFNIALTYQTTWILPVYAIVGYFFVTGVFFREEEIQFSHE